MGWYLFSDFVDVYVWEDDGRVVATTIKLSDELSLSMPKKEILQLKSHSLQSLGCTLHDKLSGLC